MVRAKEAVQRYLAGFQEDDQEAGAQLSSWIRPVRRSAIDRFVELGFPGKKQEEWRFTDLAPLAALPFEPANGRSDEVTREQFRELAVGADAANHLVFVNGRFVRRLSSTGALPSDVFVGSLAEVVVARPDQGLPGVTTHLARGAQFGDHAFVALNTAFIRDGALVYVPPGRKIDEPIYVTHLSTAPGRPGVSHPRNLIVATEGSEVRVLESYVGPEGHVYFANAVTEIVLGEGAVCDHYKLQRESSQAFHLGTVHVRQQRASRFASHWVSLGGKLVRNEVNVSLEGEGCECTLDGLYLADGQRHVDNRTRIDHAAPHCHSFERYKGILDDRARGVFCGKIYVHQDAQKTDAKQGSQVLLLSDEAKIDAKPQLEIYADDVKCTHGATVGQIDPEALFYLRSRGIDQTTARNLLIYAFANEVVGRIGLDSVRNHLETTLLATRGLSRTPHEATA
jgi:Fe-S cluster assembly protein SufD